MSSDPRPTPQAKQATPTNGNEAKAESSLPEVFPGVLPEIRPEEPPAADQQAEDEAAQLESDAKAAAIRRGEEVRDTLHWWVLLMIKGALSIGAIAGIILAWHYLAPEAWHWLAERHQSRLYDGLATAIAGMGLSSAMRLYGIGGASRTE